MALRNGNQITTRVLIIYLVSSILFLTSVKLHIHAHQDAVNADTASPMIHISSVTSNLDTKDKNVEINISPLGVLKANQNDFLFISVILIAVLIAILPSFEFVTRVRDIQTRLPGHPFYGSPLLRAPPVLHS